MRRLLYCGAYRTETRGKLVDAETTDYFVPPPGKARAL
jgi:hypothetical protein